MQKIRVLLVDDHPSFARAARQLLQRIPRLEVLAAAGSAAEALARLDGENPDLVLMDINMPVMNGIDATRRIKARLKAPKVVAISFEHTLAGDVEARNAGADAVLAKTQLETELPQLLERLFPCAASKGCM